MTDTKRGIAVSLFLDEEKLEAFSSPLRLELLTVLRNHGAASANEIAAIMGVSPKGLYHHLGRLRDAEVIIVQETRKVGKRSEQVYALREGHWEASLNPEAPEYLEHLVRSTSAMLRTVDREQERATRVLPEQPELATAMHCRRVVVRLEPDRLQELIRLLTIAEKYALENQTPESGQHLSMLTVVLPLIRRPIQENPRPTQEAVTE